MKAKVRCPHGRLWYRPCEACEEESRYSMALFDAERWHDARARALKQLRERYERWREGPRNERDEDWMWREIEPHTTGTLGLSLRMMKEYDIEKDTHQLGCRILE